MEVAILLRSYTDIGAYIPGRSHDVELIEDVQRTHLSLMRSDDSSIICMLPLMYPPTMIAIANRLVKSKYGGTVGLVLYCSPSFTLAALCTATTVYIISVVGTC